MAPILIRLMLTIMVRIVSQSVLAMANGGTTTVTVNITVTAVNDAPTWVLVMLKPLTKTRR